MTSISSWDDDEAVSGSNDETENNSSEYDQIDASAAQTVAAAAPEELDAHRNLIGETLAHLSDQGIDVEELAEKAGISSSDVHELTHRDLAELTQYLAQNHPELLQAVAERFPEAQGLLGAITGNSGGLGGLLGKFLGQ